MVFVKIQQETDVPVDLFAVVGQTLSEARRSRLRDVATRRLPWLRCVLQDVHGVHNISACMRSCEAFGVGDVDIVSLIPTARGTSFRPSSVACGIDRWLNISEYHSAESCKRFLHSKGFRLYAGMPATSDRPLTSMDQMVMGAFEGDHNIAVLFGNEHQGIHTDWHQYMDGFFSIPTTGFVESLNVSVAVATTLYGLVSQAMALYPDHPHGRLSEDKVRDLMNIWITRTVPRWRQVYEQLKPRS